jgi:REP element-mobilizing transposase RayT
MRRAPCVSWGVLQFVFLRVSDGSSNQRRSTIGLTPDARRAVFAHGDRRAPSVSWAVLDFFCVFTLRLTTATRTASVDRCWLLTWTTYGNWLPGDERGFVSAVRDQSGVQTTHNQPGTEYDCDRTHLESYSQQTQKFAAVRLTLEQAAAVCRQIQTTAEHRHWKLFAVAVMANHVHVVVGVPGDPDPSMLLRDLKSYGARELNRISPAHDRQRQQSSPPSVTSRTRTGRWPSGSAANSQRNRAIKRPASPQRQLGGASTRFPRYLQSHVCKPKDKAPSGLSAAAERSPGCSRA